METLKNTKNISVPAPVIKTGDTNIDEVLSKLHKKEQAFIDAKQAWALERQALISDKQRTNTQSQYQLHVQSNELRAQLAEAEDKVQSDDGVRRSEGSFEDCRTRQPRAEG